MPPKADSLRSLRIVLVHYHLFPGGVTTSILNSIESLSRAGELKNKEIVVLCGHERGTDEFQRALEKERINVTLKIDPSLFYHLHQWPDSDFFYENVRATVELLLSHVADPTLFWIHNPTIGKNPALTHALAAASSKAEESGLPCRFLYHIHDFPESGRPSNLEFLENPYPGGGACSVYPTTRNAGLICINRADLQVLLDCGVLRERLFFLPNAIPDQGSRPQTKTRAEVAGAIRDYARREGFRFDEEKAWWVLPVRMIRRKNVMEALFLAAAVGGVQVLITLNANSEPEYPYAEAVKRVVREQNLPVVAGFGHELVGSCFSIHDLICAADAVVSTSLMEGFGFSYLEGPMRGKAFLGRNLPGVTADFSRAGLPVSHLYDRFLLPVPLETRERIFASAIRFAGRYAKAANLSESRLKTYAESAEVLYENEHTDLGDLDLEGQLSLLSRIRDASFLREIQKLNQQALQSIPMPETFPKGIEKEFGPKRHAERICEIVNCLFGVNAEDSIPSGVGQKLKEKFFTPERNRPLFWD